MQGKNELARMRLAQVVESWHCGLAQNLEVFKAEADFASDCSTSIKAGTSLQSVRLKAPFTGSGYSVAGKSGQFRAVKLQG
jgi:hypothetical protein